MGNEPNKNKNSELEEIGKKANENSPQSFIKSSNLVKITTATLIGENTLDAEQHYKKLKLLGQGISGSVYEVQNRITDIIRAMKVIKKKQPNVNKNEEEIKNEINILRTMDHPNIVKILEFYSTDEEYQIINENCKGGRLLTEITTNGPFNEDYTAYVMYQIFSAINYCHKMHIIHRDLKLENILIFNKNKNNNYPNVKICDFGTSTIAQKDVMEKKLVGTIYYIAPEVIKKNYNEKCDLWSCGVIMYFLLSKHPPFRGQFNQEILENIQKAELDLKSPPFNNLSENCLDLLKKLLERDINKRIGASEALNHPWLKEHKSKELFNEIVDQSIVERLLLNLKNYKKNSIIQETALAYLVHNFPQMKDVINACKIFNQIDANGDGKITKQELYDGLKSKIKIELLEENIDQIYSKLDMDNDGFIEYEEFVRAAVSKEKFMGENVLKFAFRFFDKDDSGKITLNEIEAIFKKSITDKEHVEQALNAIIHEVDVNRDGKISFEEFSKVMKKMLE